MITRLLMERDLFCVSSECWLIKNSRTAVFFLFNSAQKALNSCLSHVTLLHALRPSGPS